MVNVVCMKWGDKFEARYVNILRAMVKRHLQRPHRFCCFTDDPSDIAPDVEIFPLPEISLPKDARERCWRKLAVFRRDLFDLQGTTLFLDLDVVITDDLSVFFDLDGDFFISPDWRWYGRLRATGNSSVFRFQIGEHADILDEFEQNQEAFRDQFRNDQWYLSAKMRQKGLLRFWPDGWCVSFKMHCIPRIPFRYFQAPVLPRGARVLVFHGIPNPPDAIQGGYRSLRKVWRPTPWLSQHWTTE